ncbi:MAG TPA: hypothetical protein VMA34_01065 [Terracidiphilus sp.]|nr:hypothetical protein [Terracidiphilus sp.]
MGDLLQPWHILVLTSVFGIFFVIPAIFYILTLQGALKKCSEASRTLEPGMIWLLLVPFVNLIWHFFVVMGIANSLGNEFKMRNWVATEPQPGQSIGLAMCICAACSIIPFLGVIAGVASLVLWIIYWAKIGEYSRLLSGTQASVGPVGI